MSDPVSTSTVASVALGSMTVASLFQYHNVISVILGAMSGSLIYILSLERATWQKKTGYFVVSFFTGLTGATTATEFIAKISEGILQHPVTISQSLGAVVAAAVAVRLLVRCMDKITPPSDMTVKK